jgi:hypothetical protein
VTINGRSALLDLRQHAIDCRLLLRRQLRIGRDFLQLLRRAAVVGFVDDFDGFIDAGLSALISRLKLYSSFTVSTAIFLLQPELADNARSRHSIRPNAKDFMVNIAFISQSSVPLATLEAGVSPFLAIFSDYFVETAYCRSFKGT